MCVNEIKLKLQNRLSGDIEAGLKGKSFLTLNLIMANA
jgi:hypothetical protein